MLLPSAVLHNTWGFKVGNPDSFRPSCDGIKAQLTGIMTHSPTDAAADIFTWVCLNLGAAGKMIRAQCNL